jgi:hypothetical protein
MENYQQATRIIRTHGHHRVIEDMLGPTYRDYSTSKLRL